MLIELHTYSFKEMHLEFLRNGGPCIAASLCWDHELKWRSPTCYVLFSVITMCKALQLRLLLSQFQWPYLDVFSNCDFMMFFACRTFYFYHRKNMIHLRNIINLDLKDLYKDKYSPLPPPPTPGLSQCRLRTEMKFTCDNPNNYGLHIMCIIFRIGDLVTGVTDTQLMKHRPRQAPFFFYKVGHDCMVLK